MSKWNRHVNFFTPQLLNTAVTFNIYKSPLPGGYRYFSLSLAVTSRIVDIWVDTLHLVLESHGRLDPFWTRKQSPHHGLTLEGEYERYQC